MDYCGPAGIPHSKFLEWDEDDQDKAISWMLDQRFRCPHCLTYPDEWLDDEGRRMDPPPYHAASSRCYGCVTLEELREFIRQDVKKLTGFNVYLAEGPPSEKDPAEGE